MKYITLPPPIYSTTSSIEEHASLMENPSSFVAIIFYLSENLMHLTTPRMHNCSSNSFSDLDLQSQICMCNQNNISTKIPR